VPVLRDRRLTRRVTIADPLEQNRGPIIVDPHARGRRASRAGLADLIDLDFETDLPIDGDVLVAGDDGFAAMSGDGQRLR
jgi:hypothetical protein